MPCHPWFKRNKTANPSLKFILVVKGWFDFNFWQIWTLSFRTYGSFKNWTEKIEKLRFVIVYDAQKELYFWTFLEQNGIFRQFVAFVNGDFWWFPSITICNEINKQQQITNVLPLRALRKNSYIFRLCGLIWSFGEYQNMSDRYF